jgi:hypothetical protein
MDDATVCHSKRRFPPLHGRSEGHLSCSSGKVIAFSDWLMLVHRAGS